ncbi:MAG: helix-turn-helix domain-containing protein [Synergistaceae bacterium]|nr:helix-turn-helix domain-containing protein [Synergistaceae bacterium]
MVTKISEIHSGFYFIQPDNVVMFDEVLSQTAKVVYCNLLSHVKKGTNKCKLYISTIAEEVKRSVRTVRRALSQLCERGVIVRLLQYGNKQNQLASLFVIIGKNAACYQDTSHQVRQSALAEANNVNAENTLEENTAQGVPSETKTASLPKCQPPMPKTADKITISVITRVY